jgi:hypothetical protein
MARLRAAPRTDRADEELARAGARAERLMQPDDVSQATLNAVILPRITEITELRIHRMRKTRTAVGSPDLEIVASV